MNKSSLPMPARARKKMNKAVRDGVLHPEPISVANDTKKTPLLSSSADNLKKQIANKKKKLSQKHSKRSGPGFADGPSAPQSVHIEGKRWIKTLAKQGAAKNKIFNRKSIKGK